VVQEAFLEHLRRSRLLTVGQVGEIAGRCASGDPPQALLEELVAGGVLTPFQAERIRMGAAAGLILGQYRLLDELGKGGFGRVYRALHTVMDRVVALKVIAPEFAENERMRSWFKREVLAITRLAHPNVVMAHDAGDCDGALFLVMEHVDGPNLDKLVRSQGPLSITLACEVVRQTALALQYAHDQGMVHRDIKPANLLIQRAALEALPMGGYPPRTPPPW
jgi:serine/threonine-protein kinase